MIDSFRCPKPAVPGRSHAEGRAPKDAERTPSGSIGALQGIKRSSSAEIQITIPDRGGLPSFVIGRDGKSGKEDLRMYRAYRLALDEDTQQELLSDYRKGKDNTWVRGESCVMKMSPGYRKISEEMKDCISSCLPSGASLLRDDFDRAPYPLVSADVFLMHSKRDTELAMSIAWWLEVNMGLRVFLDSWFRDHSKAIRSEIQFRAGCGCIPEERLLDMENVAVSGTLVKIIDGTECLMFLDSINAIRDMDPSLGKENYLGRLYYELLVARLIRRRTSERQRRNDAEEFKRTGWSKQRDNRGNRILTLDAATMKEWHRLTEPPTTSHPLDALYDITPVK